MHDVIILGGGPAGLTAGIYCARANLDVVLLDKQLPGGQLNNTTEVENYPGFAEPIQGPELMDQMRRQAERFQLKIHSSEEVVDVELGGRQGHTVVTDSSRYATKALIIASGANPVPLPAKGAERLAGRGVSYCATCDGFFFKGQTMIVVGGGDSALTEALFLTKFAKEVHIAVRHPQDDPHALRAKDQTLRKRAMEHPKIRFLWNVTLDEVLGQQKVEAVALNDLGSGRKRRMDEVGAVFVAIGHRPATGFLKGKLRMDEEGYLWTDERTRTQEPGVYAVGDVRQLSSRYAQAIIAAGDGCIAALEALDYLEDSTWLEESA